MQVQWFPGHMHKARKEIEKVLPQVDLVIEVLDARIPYSSENPMIAEFRKNKPCIKLLNKADLADPAESKRWQAFLEQDQNTKTLMTQIDEPDSIRKLTSLCRKLFPEREEHFKPINTMIMGIPNVGKSSIINILAGRMVAKTGNEPAITKAQQRIRLDNGITLSDTPGVLWPNVENKNSGYRLAMTGAVKDTAIDHSDIAYFAVEFYLNHYPELLSKRYQLNDEPGSVIDVMEFIGRKRGCLGGGGLVDFDKVAKIILTEYRAGALGNITLETPEVMQREVIETAAIQLEKEEKKKARLEKRKKKKRNR